jgi:hypothetical protein
MPVSWEKAAMPSATISAGRTQVPRRARQLAPRSWVRTASISAISPSTSAPGRRSRFRTDLASPARPWPMSQRGLSGSGIMPTARITAGKAAMANIQRQPPGPASAYPTRYEMSWPTATMSWNSTMSRPRISAGAVSAM